MLWFGHNIWTLSENLKMLSWHLATICQHSPQGQAVHTVLLLYFSLLCFDWELLQVVARGFSSLFCCRSSDGDRDDWMLLTVASLIHGQVIIIIIFYLQGALATGSGDLVLVSLQSALKHLVILDKRHLVSVGLNLFF
jgi:hypothetical protein